jgi:predicted NAD/FAD-binding protein
MKIAVVGSGISGLGSAYILSRAHEVTLYEKEDYFGGHSRTIDVKTEEGEVPVDTGFLVFNRQNYPHLTGLFGELSVPVMETTMEFGVSLGGGEIEYILSPISVSFLFSQFYHVFNPGYWGMLRDILRFSGDARSYRDRTDVTIGEMLEELGLGKWFCDYYLLPLSQGIWSTLSPSILDFPAHTLVIFFEKHNLLEMWKTPTWHTVKGGSREYVKRVCEGMRGDFRLGLGVERVERESGGVRVYDSKGGDSLYDHVILGCHSDQSLEMNVSATSAERDILGSIRYSKNETVVHSDERLMPKNRRFWASWVSLSEGKDLSYARSFSYWLNRLQSIETRKPLIETVNPSIEIREESIYERHSFSHPIFDQAAIRAQGRVDEIQGEGGLWYCGAWQGYGFHEDGLASGVRVAKKLGVDCSWSV